MNIGSVVCDKAEWNVVVVEYSAYIAGILILIANYYLIEMYVQAE